MRDEVLRAWLPMAYRIAGSFREKGESLEDLRQVAALGQSYSALSLYAPNAEPGADGTSLAAILGAPDHGFQLVVDRESVKEAVGRLPSRERALLYLRFFEDWPQARIAERLGISQMHVSRLLSQTCARLRRETLHPGEWETGRGGSVSGGGDRLSAGVDRSAAEADRLTAGSGRLTVGSGR
ncbi:sigma-70 family RNA polymerase sigma factor [Streptomyces sp. NPDC052773]|uniref:sigma-70 family RNA polymerase sigma factor n=1 Tax=Streptomyces sp. NPDC052773 TaxID=3365693 RepID=UPI0037D5B7D5